MRLQECRTKYQIQLPLLIFLFSFTGMSCAQNPQIDTSPLPNIIYILADDLGYGDLGCYGQIKIETPNIDAMAADGLLFTEHYAGAPVCAPSRSSLLTGQHTGHTPIRGNKEVQPEGQYPIPGNDITLLTTLKSAGYTTGVFGKWGLGFPGSEGDPMNQSVDEFYGYNCQRIAHNYYPYYLWRNKEKDVLTGNAGRSENEYAPELIHERALSFLEANRDKPFFLFYASNLPHAELAAPDSLISKYHSKFGEENAYSGTDAGPNYKNGGYGSQIYPRAAYAAMVSLLDAQVGELRAKIKDLNLEEKTLIVFTSDNGPHREGGNDPDFFNSNAQFRGYKRDVYEAGIRVPMIAVWPTHIAPDTQSDLVSAFWDMLPTVADLAKIDTPISTDGISMLPTLLGRDQPAHNYLYWEFHEEGGKQAVRMDKWKAVRLNVNGNPNGPVELYDLSQDPSEQNNVAAANRDIVSKMTTFMAEAHTSSGIFPFEFETRGEKLMR